MDAWPQRHGLQTMNLRSVFTLDQQRILERYYNRGMTNQSKSCFQLILQCAQDAKLDFSVVRTWVGNKRRKIASRVEHNGMGMSHSLSSHGLPRGLLSNHAALPGAALSNQSLAAIGLDRGVVLPAEIAAARSAIQNRSHPRLPPSSTFPSFSSTSSSPSSSSPLSSGSNNNNNNNDVILTGIYSLNSAPRSKQRPTAPLPPPPTSKSDIELSAHTSVSLFNQVLQGRGSSTSSPIHSKLVSLSQDLTQASGPLVYTAVKKGPLSLGEAGISVGAGLVPHSWARQYGTTRPWSSSSKSHTQPRPHSNPQPQPLSPATQKTCVGLPIQNSGPSSSSSEQTPRIQQVFTLSERGVGDRLRPSDAPSITKKGKESHRPDTSHNFSIAMETADEEDEWQREEELANMAAQTHIHRERVTSVSPARGEGSEVGGGSRTPPPMKSSRPASYHSNTRLHGSYDLTAQTSHTGESSTQTSVGVSAGPWVISNSRKRTLQDRTQFSDGDLIQLKRYWDRGMTSLGSVCREKITAAANQLTVDTEIVKTWISNRRRKYRLMGIEIPPPKGGPAVFTSTPGHESPLGLSPDEERLRTPDLGDDLNDEGSLCLSEDGTIDSQHRDGEDGIDVSTAAPLANNVKIEMVDEEDDDYDYNEDLVASDLEQMQGLLEFKHEEVQFLEHELENQKQRYHDLANFTKSLLSAVREKDLERQQELMASLPQRSEQDWDMATEGETQPTDLSNDAFSNHDGLTEPPASPSHEEEEVQQVTTNQDDTTTTQVTEPSASEEKLQEAVSEQK